MKEDLMKLLACPVCKRELELELTEEKAGEIWTGSLTCTACHERYPISEGIPSFLYER